MSEQATRQQTIYDKLQAAFNAHYLDVENESHQHNVPPGSESHFKIVMVSDSFAGQRLVARHQAVYAVLQEELQGGVHALAMHLYDLPEWQQRNNSAPESPPCLGGSKAG